MKIGWVNKENSENQRNSQDPWQKQKSEWIHSSSLECNEGRGEKSWANGQDSEWQEEWSDPNILIRSKPTHLTVPHRHHDPFQLKASAATHEKEIQRDSKKKENGKPKRRQGEERREGRLINEFHFLISYHLLISCAQFHAAGVQCILAKKRKRTEGSAVNWSGKRKESKRVKHERNKIESGKREST